MNALSPLRLVSAAGLDASGVLMELKRRADVRHLPVHVFEEGGAPARWWAAGAAFVHSAAGDDEAAAMFGLSFDMPVVSSVDVPALVLAIAAATAIFRFNLGMLWVLGGSCAAGVLMRVLGII